MAALIYTAIASLDGYIADDDGNFDWAAPSEEVHAYVNDLIRPVGTYLYGRRMYEVMQYWEGPQAVDGGHAVERDFADVWRAADKIVFSRTLMEVSSARTRIVREFNPDSIRQLKADSESDLGIGGPDLAGQAVQAGLVDEYQLFLMPVLVGGGTKLFPSGIRQRLELLDQRHFDGGVVHLRYRVAEKGQLP